MWAAWAQSSPWQSNEQRRRNRADPDVGRKAVRRRHAHLVADGLHATDEQTELDWVHKNSRQQDGELHPVYQAQDTRYRVQAKSRNLGLFRCQPLYLVPCALCLLIRFFKISPSSSSNRCHFYFKAQKSPKKAKIAGTDEYLQPHSRGFCARRRLLGDRCRGQALPGRHQRHRRVRTGPQPSRFHQGGPGPGGDPGAYLEPVWRTPAETACGETLRSMSGMERVFSAIPAPRPTRPRSS